MVLWDKRDATKTCDVGVLGSLKWTHRKYNYTGTESTIRFTHTTVQQSRSLVHTRLNSCSSNIRELFSLKWRPSRSKQSNSRTFFQLLQEKNNIWCVIIINRQRSSYIFLCGNKINNIFKRYRYFWINIAIWQIRYLLVSQAKNRTRTGLLADGKQGINLSWSVMWKQHSG